MNRRIRNTAIPIMNARVIKLNQPAGVVNSPMKVCSSGCSAKYNCTLRCVHQPALIALLRGRASFLAPDVNSGSRRLAERHKTDANLTRAVRKNGESVCKCYCSRGWTLTLERPTRQGLREREGWHGACSGIRGRCSRIACHIARAGKSCARPSSH